MLRIQTDHVTVEIELNSHFYLKRGDAEDDSIRVAWNDLEDSAAANLKQFAEMIEGTLEGMIPKAE
ncbi:hypothetical protein [uncultured Desulfuromusa sp.]|uniref:hypothetical protein n=1 Tax=uncultured Desulfuromusa sp. TaxID=219183 RepID=UPI002AA86E2D|nr:hypothetical protein [uncultured Desulfuromusa sp.]